MHYHRIFSRKKIALEKDDLHIYRFLSNCLEFCHCYISLLWMKNLAIEKQ